VGGGASIKKKRDWGVKFGRGIGNRKLEVTTTRREKKKIWDQLGCASGRRARCEKGGRLPLEIEQHKKVWGEGEKAKKMS